MKMQRDKIQNLCLFNNFDYLTFTHFHNFFKCEKVKMSKCLWHKLKMPKCENVKKWKGEIHKMWQSEIVKMTKFENVEMWKNLNMKMCQ